PYLQAIVSSKTKRVAKYESLMRIADEQRNIHSHFEFLEVAKKIDRYGELSHLMIKNTFELMKERETTFSINVTEDDGSIAVVGVFIDNVAGEGNEALESAFGVEIPEEEEENPTEVTINPLDMLPGGKVYSYSGSLTTPPCTEDVAWNIYTKHIGLHEDKVKAFQEHYDHNFRPLTGTY
ncbi:MAG: carbonic anhydrase family protein, partial [Sulfurovum sp.]